jgi:hypothetical protein
VCGQAAAGGWASGRRRAGGRWGQAAIWDCVGRILEWGEGCGRIYQEDIPALAQAREGLVSTRRRKEPQPLKMEGVALQFWKLLEDGRCCTLRVKGVELGIKLREIRKFPLEIK